ncbi:hypothetical protein RSOLAG1IB_05262 [Rhizoctonia solani AG-1 IB]|uniref:Uncharacterized protein n=1 Tax=Thanatephorus cucumeris (strain AG1-IB / isolate 7/3/14) TaxID=1108050 RepID=A0A0B7FZU5_THACB|nr:hypothetical protein RSOLAG1IB_05262 [Rhizoctonia solani AG-1 IB]
MTGETKSSTGKDQIKPKCRIAELEQFKCVPVVGANGYTRVHCTPIPRIFRICPNRPAVEITTLVNVDPHTGEYIITSDTMNTMPRTMAWRDMNMSASD